MVRKILRFSIIPDRDFQISVNTVKCQPFHMRFFSFLLMHCLGMDRRVDGSEVPTRQPGDIRTLKFTSSDTVSLQDFPSLVKGESLHLLSSWLWGLGWLVNVKLLDRSPFRNVGLIPLAAESADDSLMTDGGTPFEQLNRGSRKQSWFMDSLAHYMGASWKCLEVALERR